MSAKCVRCGAELVDTAYACTACTTKARSWLTEIADMTPAARDIAHGLTRHGDSGSSGKPESRLPFDLNTTAKLDSIQRELTSWVDAIAHHRGLTRPWFTHRHGDPITLSAEFLLDHGNLEWIRHRDQQAEEFLTDIDACARIIRGIVRGPAEQKYLGPCGAPVTEIDQIIDEYGEDPAVGLVANRCDGDIYGYVGAEKGRCRTCKAQVSQDERRAWLDEQARSTDLAWSARGIADAYGISPKTIRSWATERRSETGHLLRAAKLSTFWRDTEGRLVPWVEPDRRLTEAEREAEIKRRGARLHYVADVMTLAEEAADRRAERERREAARQNEGEAA